ncbi:MAG TPA: lyase, partial [Thermoanaerobaculia bacterium]|nr:lyase [Thermoanaerobaculia bacterium]
GTVWYAGNRAAHVGRLDPGTGEIEKLPTPDPEGAGRDPHTLIFDGAGSIWFSVQGGNSVGRLDMESGEIALLDVPTERARPYGIVATPSGRPWLTEFGSNKLATVDPETMELREVALPREDARPRRLALTSDGAVWYVDYARGYLGRLEPESGEIDEWPVPGGPEARPYAMASDDQDRLWFVESGPEPNRLVGFDPETGEFFATAEIPSGGGTVRHMVFHAPTRTIWFGADTNTIGRAKVP